MLEPNEKCWNLGKGTLDKCKLRVKGYCDLENQVHASLSFYSLLTLLAYNADGHDESGLPNVGTKNLPP